VRGTPIRQDGGVTSADVPSPITVGRLGADDRPDWAELFRGYNTFYGRTMPEAVYDRAWAAFAEDSRMHALGATLVGELVGITHFLTHASTTAADVCYLQDLFTAPQARGRGVASALIAAVADWARAAGCSRVYWSTHESNASARRLYDQVADYRGFIRYEIPF
jgi:GNAT superfamily N-acetyltransferase